jgi:hypothetical protein
MTAFQSTLGDWKIERSQNRIKSFVDRVGVACPLKGLARLLVLFETCFILGTYGE